MAIDIWMAIYYAIAKGMANACCIIFASCTPAGPTVDGPPMSADSCSKPSVEITCDCQKYGWRRP